MQHISPLPPHARVRKEANHAANYYSHPLCSYAHYAFVDERDGARFNLAATSGCRNAAGGLSPSGCDAGAIRYYGYADETSPQPVDTLTIEAGQFGVFPPEKWHRIEALTEDTVFNVDFMLILKF
jgi:hypothetical protein